MNSKISRIIRSAMRRIEFRVCQRKYSCISYVVKHKEASSDLLIVVFSGFSSIGKPPRYNYIETLKNVNATQLFILDDTGYNRAGSYYLGDNNSFYIPKRVCELISKIKQNANCKCKLDTPHE